MHWTKRIHRIASLILVLFVCLHLFNHLWAWAGIDAHLQMMDSLRLIYRHPLVEGILFAAILAQIISGLWQIKGLSAAERRQNWLQVGAGLYLLLFLLAHTSAVLNARYVQGLDTNFYFASIVLLDHTSRLFFIPYYSLGVLAFFAHLGSGFQWYLPEAKRLLFVRSMLVVGLVIAAMIIVLFSGWMYDIPRLPQYESILLF
ncbi:MAG: hypothetical protein AAFQ68_07070 [Bacteroidota bacterium]